MGKIKVNNLAGVTVGAQSWNIAPDLAKQLISEIEEEKLAIEEGRKTIRYLIQGNKNISDKSSSRNGHSCFTWAREKINNLGDENTRVEELYTDWVVALPSFYIKDPRQNNISGFWTPARVGGVAGVAVVSAAVGAALGPQLPACTIL